MTDTSEQTKQVTCSKCGHGPYVPNLAFDFYREEKDPSNGLCEGCYMGSLYPSGLSKPLPSDEHRDNVCRLRQSGTCAFLVVDASGFQCAKGSLFEPHIRMRLAEGSMRATGDNCYGSPEFTPRRR